MGVRKGQAGRGVESWGGGRGQCGRPRTRALSMGWGGVGRGCREPSPRARWGSGRQGRGRGAEGRGSEGRGSGRRGPRIGAPRAGNRGAEGRGSGRRGPGVRAQRAGDPDAEAARSASSGTARPQARGPPLKADASRTAAQAHPALASWSARSRINPKRQRALHAPSPRCASVSPLTSLAFLTKSAETRKRWVN